MDLGNSVNQTSGVLAYSSNFNSQADAANTKANAKMNSSINMANAKGDFGRGVSGGSAGYQGVAAGLTTAREVGNARNFDSEVAGFGSGKGTSGYLSSQGQIARGRIAQGSNRAKYAVGATSKEDYSRISNNPKELGLSETNPFDGPGTESITTPGKDTSGIEFGGKDADTDKLVPASAEGKSISKASGGLIGEASKGAEGGVEGGVVKKLGQYISDVPKGQLAAAGDVIGKVAGVAQAGMGIYDLASGKDKTTESKWAGVGDIVSGGLDIAATVMPVLAPLAAVGAGVSAVGDYFADKDEQAAGVAGAKGKNKQQAQLTGTNLAGQGRVAQQSLGKF